MSEYADIAAFILQQQGESVSYQIGDGDPVILNAVVAHHGHGYCPTGWSSDLFPNQAQHAEIRMAAEDSDGNAMPEPQVSDGLTITAGGLTYTVREVTREPKIGPKPLWWVCRCACNQRSKY
ncbi:hypothetical protein [Humidesulfovibrio idahonensis]